MEQLEIDYFGIKLCLWGYHYQKTDEETASFDIREIYNGDDNIIELLRENIVSDLEQKALEQLS